MAILFAGSTSSPKLITGTLTTGMAHDLVALHSIPPFARGLKIISLFLVGGGGGSGEKGANTTKEGQGGPGGVGWDGFTYTLSSEVYFPSLSITSLIIKVGGEGTSNHALMSYNADAYSWGETPYEQYYTYGPGIAHFGYTWNGGGDGGNAGGRSSLLVNGVQMYYAEGGAGGYGGDAAHGSGPGDHGGMTKDVNGVDYHYIGGSGYLTYGQGGTDTSSGGPGTAGYASYVMEYYA